MKIRILIIPLFIILLASISIPIVMAAPGDNRSVNKIYLVKLYDLHEGSTLCDFSKYTITNHGTITAETRHLFYAGSFDDTSVPIEVIYFIEPGDTETYTINLIDSLPDGWQGDVAVVSGEEITGTLLPTPVCTINVHGFLTRGFINTSYTFIAIVNSHATLPITYTWTVTDQPEVVEDDIYVDYQEYSWSTPGQKEITVTVENEGGMETETLTINI